MSTEERILEAAVAEFMLKGYAGARTAAIAEAAGVTHAMLNYDIMLSSLGDPDTPLFDKIRTAIDNHQDFIAANPNLPRFMINEVLSRPEKMPLVIRQLKNHTPLVVESLQRQIDDCAAEGLCRRVDAGMLMLDIVSLNIFPFIASPMVNALLGSLMKDREAFIEARKKENVETIMRKLRL